jgi:MerR family transcriptional regulator, heat shock protein HspR
MTQRKKAGYMISAVAEMYGIHPQTLRLYEREGLLRPSRSEGNTRLYTQEDLNRLEMILNLTRDMGVNLAGVEIILNLRERMDAMQLQVSELIRYVQTRFQADLSDDEHVRKALVRVSPAQIIRRENPSRNSG